SADLVHRTQNVIVGRPAQRAGHSRLLLEPEHVFGTAGEPLQLTADVEQQRTARPYCLRDVDQLGHGQSPQRVPIPEATAALLRVRFQSEGPLADLTTSPPGQLTQVVDAPGRRAAPVRKGLL